MRHLALLTTSALIMGSTLTACGEKTPPAATPVPAADVAATATPAVPEKPPEGPNPALLDPTLAKETAPATFKVKVTTTKGAFVIEALREWAPTGVDRFYNLVKIGFFNDIALFRIIDGFMGQFGIHGDPAVSGAWREAKIQDDPRTQTNARGLVTFATAGPNTRTTQIFINFADNARLDDMGFSPFGRVVEGMEIVDSLYKGYGEGAPRGRGPDQGRMQMQGNTYLKAEFPEMDYIVSAEVLP